MTGTVPGGASPSGRKGQGDPPPKVRLCIQVAGNPRGQSEESIFIPEASKNRAVFVPSGLAAGLCQQQVVSGQSRRGRGGRGGDAPGGV